MRLPSAMTRWTLLPAVASLLLGGCESHKDGERTVLSWRDDASRTTFVVTVRDLLAKNVSALSVSGPDGQVRKVVMDDDVPLVVVRLVRTGDWLLVLNDQYVLGGYNYASGQLVGEAHWDELPFTVRKNAGTVVAEVKVGQSERAGVPAGFPLIEEGTKESTGTEPALGS